MHKMNLSTIAMLFQGYYVLDERYIWDTYQASSEVKSNTAALQPVGNQH